MTPEMVAPHSQTREVGLPEEILGAACQALSDKDWWAQMVGCGVSPLIAKAQIRHRRDLNELLRDHGGAWVAYRGDERLEIGSSKTRLYRKYFDQGMGRDELLVLCVEADLFDDELDFPPPA
jgi:hypothetical protein